MKCPLKFEVEVQAQIHSSRREMGHNAVLTITNILSEGCNGTKITLCFSNPLEFLDPFIANLASTRYTLLG